MDVVKEIASTLRSTDSMAEAFANRVRDKVGQDVPDQVILDVLKKLNPRSIEINRVVSEVKTNLNKQARRTGNRSSKALVVQAPQEEPAVKNQTQNISSPSFPIYIGASIQPPKTLADQIEGILINNWNRAEKEGLKPSRMDVNTFIEAVHRHTDPRDATRRRIHRACKTIDSKDVLITPTLVADTIRERD